MPAGSKQTSRQIERSNINLYYSKQLLFEFYNFLLSLIFMETNAHMYI